MLELLFVKVVDVAPISLRVDPILIGRHAKLAMEQRRTHRLTHQGDAFLGEQGAHGVHCLESRNHGVDIGEGGRAGFDPRVGLKCRGPGWGGGEHHLPCHRRSIGRILGKDIMQDRRARARHADNENRAGDFLGADLGKPLAVRDVLESVDGMAEDPFLRDQQTDVVEFGFASKRIEESVQGAQKGLVAEVLKTLCPPCRLF